MIKSVSAVCDLATASFQMFSRQIRLSSSSYARKRLKNYIFPEIRSEDCDQKYITGWGPGGSKVNKSQNAVMLRHIPTNCVVKVHDSRLLSDNVKIAFERLKLTVDTKLNEQNSYENQFKRLESEYAIRMKRTREKRREIKAQLKSPNINEENKNA